MSYEIQIFNICNFLFLYFSKLFAFGAIIAWKTSVENFCTVATIIKIFFVIKFEFLNHLLIWCVWEPVWSVMIGEKKHKCTPYELYFLISTQHMQF